MPNARTPDRDRSQLRQWSPVILSILILVVIVLGIWGYYAHWKKDDFNPFGAFYDTLLMFKMESRGPGEINWQLIVARYLAAVIVGFGIYTLVVRHLQAWWQRFLVTASFRNHTIIAGLGQKGYLLASDLRKSGQKVVVIENDPDNSFIRRAKKEGIVVFLNDALARKSWITAGLNHARRFILVMSEDEDNIDAAMIVAGLCTRRPENEPLKGFVHVADNNNYNLLKDYLDLQHEITSLDINIFSTPVVAAQRIWDQYPPHLNHGTEPEGKNITILISGFNETAESFLIENMILARYKDLENIRACILVRDASELDRKLRSRYPFLSEYLNYEVLEQHDDNFQTAEFHHLQWFNKITRVYVFGEQDAEVVLRAKKLRQYFYNCRYDLVENKKRCLQEPEFIACLPESTSVVDLLNMHAPFVSRPDGASTGTSRQSLDRKLAEHLNIRFFRQYSDSLTKTYLIDQGETNTVVAKVINYFYFTRYGMKDYLKGMQKPEIAETELDEFTGILARKMLEMKLSGSDPLAEIEKSVFEEIILKFGNIPGDKLRKLSINYQWHLLSDRLEDSNIYAARHASVKLLYPHETEADFKVLAPMEHARWMAEKMAFQFRYGKLSTDKAEFKLAKNELKISNLMVPFDALSEAEKQKDYDLFRLLGLVSQMLNVEC